MSSFVYGQHAVAAILTQAPQRAKNFYYVSDKTHSWVGQLVTLAQQQGLGCHRLSREQLESRFSDLGVHQGVVLEVKPVNVLGESLLEETVSQAIDKKGRVSVLALDEVQDPRNLGACLRSAAAFDVDAVIIPKRRSAALTPLVEKVACGGAMFVPVFVVTNLARTLKALQQQGLWVVGTSLEATQSLQQVDLTGNCVLVMGSEGDGMRQLTAQSCDFLAKIPMSGALPSLNVSAATTVCLYEQSRQILTKK